MNKITLMQSVVMPFGRRRHLALYWFAINPRILDSLGQVAFTQTYSGGLRADVKRAVDASVSAAADQAALNNGDAIFDVVEVVQSAGESDAALATRVRADHVAYEALYVAERRAEFAKAGTGLN